MKRKKNIFYFRNIFFSNYKLKLNKMDNNNNNNNNNLNNLKNQKKILQDWIPNFEKPNVKGKKGFLRMVITGPSDSGKSYVLKSFAKILKKQYDVIVVICGSPDTKLEYEKLFDTKLCFDTLHETIIPSIIEHNKKKKIPSKALIIYDDFANRQNKNNLDIFKTAISGRHNCISFVMVLHDLVLIDRVVRDQLTHIIITRQTSLNVYETIVNEFLLVSYKAYVDSNNSKSKDKDDIVKMLQQNTVDHNVVIVLIAEYKKNQDLDFYGLLKKYKAD